MKSCMVNPPRSFAPLVSLVILAFLAAPAAQAQSGTWINLVNGDASGVWSTPANWNNGIVADGADNTADFSTLDITTNSTITLDTARTIGNVIFADLAPDASQATNWVLTGNTLTLQVSSGTPALTASNGTNLISAVLGGTLGFAKAGDGVVRLTAANNATLSGNIHLNAGVLQIGNNNALGATTPNNSTVLSNAVVIAEGATLQLLPGIQQNFKPVYVSGAGVGGTQGAIYADLSALGNNNTSTRLSIGLTSVASPAVTMTNDATIRVEGANNSALGASMLIGHISTSNALAGIPANYTGYTLTKTGMGQLRVDPLNGYTGGNIHIAEGSLAFGNNGDLPGAQTVTIDAGTFLYCRNVTSLNSPNSTLVVNGVLDLNARGNGNHGSDTTTATQTIGYLAGSGIVTNGSAGNIGANTLVIGGTNGSSTTFSGILPQCANGTLGLRMQNAGSTLRLTGANTYQGTTAVNAGTLLVNGTHTGGGAYSVASGATLGGSGTIASAITVNGGTIVAGDPASAGGTLAIDSDLIGTSSGAIIVSNATLAVSGQIGASGQTIGTLELDNGTLQVSLPPTGASIFVSALNVDGSGLINYTMPTLVKGQFPVISYGTIGGVLGFNGLSLVSPSGVTAFLSNNVANSTIDVVITGIPALTWTGEPDGNWDIGGTTNWEGGVTYTETNGVGPYVIFDDTASGTSDVNLTTTLSPKGMTVNNSVLNYVFSGAGNLGGAGGILKQGGGTLTVETSGNTFTGGINLEQGTVQAGNGGTTGDLGSGPIANQATLALNRSDNFALANVVSGNGAITKAGAGAATVPVSGDSTGPISVNGGILTLGPVGTSTFSGAVTGVGAFGANGLGTLILTGTGNGYSGGTVVTSGTLQFGDGLGGGALPPAGNILDNGTLALALDGSLANDVSGSGGVSVISNATVTLAGNNTYTGPTAVRGSSGATLNATAAAYPTASVLALGTQDGSGERGAANFTDGNPVLGGLSAGDNSINGDLVNLSAGGQVLTINGNLSIGAVAPAGASVLFGIGGSASSIVVNTNGGTIQIGLGATGSGVNPDNVVVDFAGFYTGLGVDNFIANLGTNGALNLGTLDGNPGPTAGATVVNQFFLANVSNSITAGSLTVGAGGRQLTPDLRLGPGANVFHVASFNVGTGGRDGGTVEFNSGSGDLQIRGLADGSTRANYNQGVNPTTGTGAPFSTTVDFTGGTVDLLLGPMVIGDEPARAGGWTNVFTFDQGVLDAAGVSLSQGCRSGTTGSSTMNINGGTATLGPVSLTASTAAGTLNISGATVTVSNISSTGSGATTLSLNNATLNLNLPGFGNPAFAPIAAGSFSAGGTVNLGVNGIGFTVGQFPLISYSGSIGGSGFAALNLASLPSGVSGYLSNNTSSVDLVITAAPPAVNPYPTNIVASVSGGNTLNLSWPADHEGWTLLTNGVGLVATNAWFPYPGSTTLTNVSLTIDPTRTNVFFRLAYPYP